MHRTILSAATCLAIVVLIVSTGRAEEELPPLPERLGFGGSFAGTADGALIVAGGTNFPEAVWGQGKKVWHDGIFVLEPGARQWKQGFKLPRPLAYGVSITTEHGLVCLGGSDSRRAYKDVFLLRWSDGRIETTSLPDLPGPRAAAAGALLDGAIYMACGQTGSAELEVTNTFWRLQLPKKRAGRQPDWKNLIWERLPDCPGEPRGQAVAAAQQHGFYLISGWTLVPGAEGKPKRKFLSDAYRFDPRQGSWQPVAAVPCAAVAAAPSIACGESHIMVFGGFDGANVDRVEELKERWPGFRRQTLAYHTITNTWVEMGRVPVGLVTTNAVRWQGHVVIPGGEVRPRIRTNRIYQVEPRPRKPDFGLINSTVLGLYLVALLGMGVYFSKREKSTADFFVGGRRVPWWAAGISIFGTQLSSISFMAIPAKVYDTDWVYFASICCIALMQPIVVFFYLPFFRRLNITSAYEYLEKRFSLLVRLFGSASFILFQAGRMTIVLFLPALALSAVTGVDIYLSIIVMGVLATLYTALGGIEAVVWTDVLQVVVLVGGAIISLIVIVTSVDGGLGAIVEMGRAGGKFNMVNWGWDYTMPVLWVIVVGSLFQNLSSYTADQAVIQRYLTTPDEKTAARAIWTNALLVIPVSAVWFVLGSALYAFYKTQPALLDPTLKTDQVFPLFISGQLPVGIVGLVIAGLFAASMSTLDSSLNSISTAFVTDFYRRFRPDTSDRVCLKLARWLTVLLGLIATLTALWMAANQDQIRSLWDMYMAVLGLLMGSLAGLFALGIFTRRTHAPGALCGAVGGALALYLVQQYTQVHFFLYAAVGIVSCFAIGYLASLIMPGRKKELAGLTVFGMGEKT